MAAIGCDWKWTFEYSTTPGFSWRFQRGTFANVRNNPDLQEVRFAPVKARYFRFTALDEVWRNGWTSAAELSVIPAERD